MEEKTLSLIGRKEEDRVAHISPISDLRSDTLNAGINCDQTLLYYVSKRLVDILIATMGLFVLLPLFLLIAVCIKVADGEKVLYFREMVGLHGRRFFLIKFRTMIPDAETYLEKHPELMQKFQHSMKLEYDPRVTRIGRFLRQTYLDELPQLFNVLVGQMSIVGPRAIHQRELSLYGEYVQKRQSVKPGMTGLWQISPNRYNSYDERIPIDIQYIDTRSVRNDLIILMKTLKVFIDHTGV